MVNVERSSAARFVAAAIVILLSACAGPAPVSLPPAPPSSIAVQPVLPGDLVVSVLPFDDRTRQPELGWMRKGLPDLLAGELARLPHVTVVQRDRLEEVVREQSLQLSGRVDESSAVRVGRLAGATVLLTGSMTTVGSTLRLDVQFVGVERGVVLDSASAEGVVADPLGVAKALSMAVLARLHASPAQRVTDATVPKSFEEAVNANDAGETLARAGKLFQALEEYEKSMGAHQGYRPARTNYSNAVKALSGRELTKDFQVESVRDRRRVAARLVDRLLTGGLKAEMGQMKVTAGEGGLVAAVPVVLSVDPATIETVSDMTIRMGGAIERRPPPADRVILDFTQAAVIGRDIIKQIPAPRRAFIRLLAADGRPVAVTSGLRDWQLSRWIIPADEIHIAIERGRRVEAEVIVGDLTEEEVARIARAEIIVEPVPQERATVRVEYVDEPAAPPAERPAHVYRPGSKSESAPPKLARPDDPGPRPGELLQRLIVEAWNPPITAHGAGSAVLPGNLRAAVATLTIEENGDIVAPPRLLSGSGESLFDDAALDAIAAAIPQWIHARRVIGPVAGSPRFVDRPGRLRISFQLVKDVPSINVMSVLAASRPLSRALPSVSSSPPDSPR
jgi:TolB-like protein